MKISTLPITSYCASCSVHFYSRPASIYTAKSIYDDSSAATVKHDWLTLWGHQRGHLRCLAELCICNEASGPQSPTDRGLWPRKPNPVTNTLRQPSINRRCWCIESHGWVEFWVTVWRQLVRDDTLLHAYVAYTEYALLQFLCQRRRPSCSLSSKPSLSAFYWRTQNFYTLWHQLALASREFHS